MPDSTREAQLGAPGETLLYGSPVSLEALAFPGLRLSGFMPQPDVSASTCRVTFQPMRTMCEQWYLLDPNDLSSKRPIRYGDTIALSCCDRATCCLSTRPLAMSSSEMTMTNAIGDSERWQVIDPFDPFSHQAVPRFGTVALRETVGLARFLAATKKQPGPSGNVVTVSDLPGGTAQFRLAPGGGVALASAGPPRAAAKPTLGIDGPDRIDCFAGELVEFAIIQGSRRINNVTWAVTGDPIADYINGQIVPLRRPLEGRTARFHWTRPGEFTLTVVVVGLGQNMEPYSDEKTVVIGVRAPIVERAGTEAGEIRLQIGEVVDGSNTRTVLFTQARQPTEDYRITGFVMAVGVRADGPAAGEFRWVQLARSDRNETKITPEVEIRHTTNGEFWLDNRLPYNAGQIRFRSQRQVVCEVDEPGQTFFVEGLRQTSSYDIADDFQMFLQWNCGLPAATWVTLAKFDWRWRAVVEEPPPESEHSRYSITADDYTNKNETPAPPRRRMYSRAEIGSSELPVWTRVLNSEGFRNPLDPVDEAGRPLLPAWPEPKSTKPIEAFTDDVIVMFQFEPFTPVFVPLSQPGLPIKPSKTAAEEALQRHFAPSQIAYQGKNWWLSWASLATARGVPYFNAVQRYPRELRMANVDLSPPTPDPKGRPGDCWFVVHIAPLGWGEGEYWSQYARKPLSIVGFGEEDDRSLDGYRRKVKAILPSAQVLRRNEDQASVWIITTGMSPSLADIVRIADLEQTFSIRRLGPHEAHLMPVPDDDRPSPDDEPVIQ